jgi:Rab GDP dissociation inhibitor
MLAKPVDGLVYDADGHVEGVRCGDEVAKTRMVIGDPTYFADKVCVCVCLVGFLMPLHFSFRSRCVLCVATAQVKKVGQVIRVICILDHPIPNTNNNVSCQIILPGNQCDRVNGAHQFPAKKQTNKLQF